MAVDWQEFIQPSPDFDGRDAQIQAFEWAANTEEFRSGDVRKLAHLVTGYGKTLLAYGVFAVLRARRIVNRMLVLVPGDEQRSQFCDDETDVRKLLRVNCPARAVEKKDVDFIYNRNNERHVFVATYAQLNDDFFLKLIASYGNWMIVLDECHHLSIDNLWGDRVEQILARFRLYLTATPLRSDRRRLRGIPTDEVSLLCRADYQQAYREQSVKHVVCCNEHYKVVCDCETGTFEVNTESLRAAKVKDFSSYEAKRQLRYNSKYLLGLLLQPITMLNQKVAQHPDEHQMLVFAMSCRHAAFICDTIREVCSTLGVPLSCEWVGVGEAAHGARKSDQENRQILDRFRAGKLNILVSVDKIGEGFSVKRASVLVFLNLLNADGKLLQQIGRGLRRNKKLRFEYDYCHVFCSSDSPVAELVGRMEQQAEEVRRQSQDDQEDRENESGELRQGGLFDIPDLTVIDSEHLRREVVSPIAPTPEQLGKVLTDHDRAFCQRYNIAPLDFYMHQISRAGGVVLHAPVETVDRSAREREEALKIQTNAAITTLVGNILRLLKDQGVDVGKEMAGKIKKDIHSEWVRRSGGKRSDGMTESDWRIKFAWVKEENNTLRTQRRLPSWLK